MIKAKMSSNLRSRKTTTSPPFPNPGEPEPGYKADKSKLSSQNYHFASPMHWILFIIYIAVVFFWCAKLDDHLPSPLSAEVAGDRRFSEERAKRHLDALSSFGPRPTNSPNLEIKTRNYVLSEIDIIRGRMRKRNDEFRFDVDVQKPSGCLALAADFVNCYKNVTNIIVRLGRKSEEPSQHSLLINCHLDSVPAAPGATDDAISCAVVLELLRVISSRSPKQLPYDLIFLFNGAEETYLQASHGFITQHPWRHSIRAFINLEGCGAGGREMLFQAGPGNSWLTHAYLTSAPYPHCNILAQEFFDYDFIPSDTDFRIFRDFGHVSGMDFAYIKNGYVYHTEFDRPSLISPGSIQRGGENLQATIYSVLNSPCFTKPCPEQDVKLVFFDVLGLFVVSYPVAYGTLLNYALSILVILRILRKLQKSDSYSSFEFFLALGSHAVGTAVIFGATLIMIRVVTRIDLTMCWYSKQFMVLPLYIIPTLVLGMAVHLLMSNLYFRKRSSKNPFHLEQASFDSALAVLSIGLIILTWCKIASAYYFMLHVAFPLARSLFTWCYGKLGGKGKNGPVLFAFHAISLFPVAAVGSYGCREVFQFFIPIMGRSGTVSNPEYFIGILSALCSIVIVAYMAGLVHVSKSVGEILQFLMFLCALAIAVAALTPYGSPYRYDPEAPRLRRLRLQHVARTIRNADGRVNSSENALFITGYDYRGLYDLPPATFLQGSRKPPCIKEDAFCALPYARPSEDSCPPEKNLWITVPSAPHFSTPIKLQAAKREEIAGGMLKFSFSITTHDFASLFITPLNNWVLHEWTFTSHVLVPQQTYFIRANYVGRSPDIGPWEFALTMKPGARVTPSTRNESKLLLGVASHYVYGMDQYSESTLGLVKSIRERRENPPTATLGYWKWMMTPEAFNSEYVAQYFT